MKKVERNCIRMCLHHGNDDTHHKHKGANAQHHHETVQNAKGGVILSRQHE